MNNVTSIDPNGIEPFAILPNGSSDFDRALVYSFSQMSKALGIAPDLIIDAAAGESTDAALNSLERVILAQSQALRLNDPRDYQVQSLSDLLNSWSPIPTQRKFRLIRTSSARKRKAYRQASIKYSPSLITSHKWRGILTGRLNRSEPAHKWSIPKPRTEMSGLIDTLKGVFRD